MRVKVLGKVWDLRFVPNLSNRGDCDSPDTKNKKIRILSSLKGEERLEVIVHELLHASNHHLFSEEWVEQAAKDIARTLHRLGYRDV